MSLRTIYILNLVFLAFLISNPIQSTVKWLFAPFYFGSHPILLVNWKNMIQKVEKIVSGVSGNDIWEFGNGNGNG